MVGNTRDRARYQELLHSVIVRMAARLAQTGKDGQRAVQTIRQQDIEAAFHEIADGALRLELDGLSTTLDMIARAKPEELIDVERRFSGRANQWTRRR